MKSIIGLTSNFDFLNNKKIIKVNNTYVNAVESGGGVPIIIPIIKELEDIDRHLDIINGLIFTGGEDVSSLLFGEEPMKEVDTICMARDKMEMELFKRAYERGIPILGICRGMQLINVSLGGTLYQDINIQLPDSLGHRCTFNIHQGYHNINILDNSILFNIFNVKKLAVNSNHHQSIKKLGENLRTTSITSDGIIESIESINDKFVLGVQFHPEAMMESDDMFKKLFNYFVDICK